MTRAEFDQEYAWRIADKVLRHVGYAQFSPTQVGIYEADAILLVRQGLAIRGGSDWLFRLVF